MKKSEILALAAAARHLGTEASRVDPVCGYLAEQIVLALHEAAGDVPRTTFKHRAEPHAALTALVTEIGRAVL